MRRTNISAPYGRQKTRSQRKRDRVKTTAMILATIAVWSIVAVMMFKTWANEQPISGSEHRAYIESLQGGDK